MKKNIHIIRRVKFNTIERFSIHFILRICNSKNTLYFYYFGNIILIIFRAIQLVFFSLTFPVNTLIFYGIIFRESSLLIQLIYSIFINIFNLKLSISSISRVVVFEKIKFYR